MPPRLWGKFPQTLGRTRDMPQTGAGEFPAMSARQSRIKPPQWHCILARSPKALGFCDLDCLMALSRARGEAERPVPVSLCLRIEHRAVTERC